VVVVGAGVSGLSCAVRLLEAGADVRVWTRDELARTTSAAAAAIWYPYLAEPAHLVLRWGIATLAELTRLAEVPATGVRMRPGIEVFREPADDPWWREAVPDFRRAEPDEIPAGWCDGYVLRLPVADMAVYLGWLAGRVVELGGRIEQRVVAGLDEPLAEAGVVVNCAGLGAREVANDATVFGVRGQVVRVVAPEVERFLLYESATEMAYVVPRSADVVLGGTADEGVEDVVPDPATADVIVARCAALDPRLAAAPRSADVVGIRPCRPTVRLESERIGDGVVIHDYGHGGAGVTLSWGCADDVAALATAVPSPR
jgi:D-amino-acid oxidase